MVLIANDIDLFIIKNSLPFLSPIAEATAVVQVEDTKLTLKSSDNMEEKEIEIMTQPKEGQDIRSLFFIYFLWDEFY